jgi:ABC-type glycerol-3-phosphate transport system substrate-binding protein
MAGNVKKPNRFSRLLCAALLLPCLLFASCDSGGGMRAGEYPVESLLSGTLNIAIAYPTESGVQAVIDAYGKYQPNVEVTYNPSLGSGYGSWLANELQSPQIMADIVTSDYATSLRYVDMGLYRNRYNQYTGNRFRDDYDFDTVKLQNALGQQTVIYSQEAQVLMFYNKDMYRAAGLVERDAGGNPVLGGDGKPVCREPKTYDELMDACAALSAAGKKPYEIGAVFSHYKLQQWTYEFWLDQYSRDLVEYARAQSGDWNYNPDLDEAWAFDPSDPYNDAPSVVTRNTARFFNSFETGKFAFNSPAFKPRYAEFLKKLHAFNQYNASGWQTCGDEYQPFLRSEFAMFLSVAGEYFTLEKDMRTMLDRGIIDGMFEFGAFMMPGITGGLTQGGVRNISNGSGEGVGIIQKNQRQTELALDFIMFWFSEPGYKAFMEGAQAANRWKPGGNILIRNVEKYQPQTLTDFFKGYSGKGNAENRLNSLYAFSLPQGGTNSRIVYNRFMQFLESGGSDGDVDSFIEEYQSLSKSHLKSTAEANGLKWENVLFPANKPG